MNTMYTEQVVSFLGQLLPRNNAHIDTRKPSETVN